MEYDYTLDLLIIKFLVAIVLVFVVALFVVWAIDNVLFAEEFKYNFTKEETQEFNLMSLCYGFGMNITLDEITTDGIPMKQFCSERYGGIDGNYGEAIK